MTTAGSHSHSGWADTISSSFTINLIHTLTPTLLLQFKLIAMHLMNINVIIQTELTAKSESYDVLDVITNS